MRMRVLVAAVLSAALGLGMAATSHADMDGTSATQVTTSTDGSSATVSGSSMAQAPTLGPLGAAESTDVSTDTASSEPAATNPGLELSESVRERGQAVVLAHDNARLNYLKTLATQYTADSQTEKAEAIRLRIQRLKVRMDRIHDRLQRVESTERAETVAPDHETDGADAARVAFQPPHIARPDIMRPEIDRPEIARPEITRPEIVRPVIQRPIIER